MRDDPPVELTDLLARLHLATIDQVRSVRRRARRLAGDMPLFDATWIDALVQTKLLTPFQANEIGAGRGEQLLVGPFVILRRLQRLGFADYFLATEVNSKRVVHLVTISTAAAAGSGTSVQAESALQNMVERFCNCSAPGIVRMQAAGQMGDTVWAAYSPAVGFPAIDWLSCQGRFSPEGALEIARQMAIALAALEAAGISHGALNASSIWLSEIGEVQIAAAGIRGLVEELDAQSCDVCQFGRLCWHLLTGRPPIGHGNCETDCQSTLQRTITSVKSVAPETPAVLAGIVDECLNDTAQRPQSFAGIAAALDPPTASSRRHLAAVIYNSGRSTLQTSWRWEAQRAFEQIGKPAIAAAACLVLLAAATYPLWKNHPQQRDQTSAVQSKLDANSTTSLLSENKTKSPSLKQIPSVQLANYQAATQSLPAATIAAPEKSALPMIELPASTEVAGATLRLQACAIVRAKEGQRSRIRTPANGLTVAADNVRFENIDFIWRQPAEEIVSPEGHAIIDLRANHVQFVGCTFQAIAAGDFELPVAIRAGASQRAAALAPAAEIQLERCMLHGIAAGVDIRTRGPAAIITKNTLFMGPGPLVRFSQPRPVDAPARIDLENVTLREAAAVIQLSGDDADSAAPLNISATSCVFVPSHEGALVLLRNGLAPKAAASLLRSVEWSGQGSLIAPDTHVVLWQHGDDPAQLAQELSVDGLVTSALEFEGEASADPAASRLRRWLGPSRSEESPGIDDKLPPALQKRTE